MNPFPFAAASPLPAASPAVLARPAVTPRPQSAGAPTHAAAARAHGHTGDGQAKPGKAKGGFASVLEAVRQDGHGEAAETSAPADPHAASITAEATPDRDPRPEARAEHESAAAAPNVAAPVEEARPAPVPTSSWLLIALEHGTLTRTEAPAEGVADGEVALDALAVTALPTGAPATDVPVVVTAVPAVAVPAAPSAPIAPDAAGAGTTPETGSVDGLFGLPAAQDATRALSPAAVGAENVPPVASDASAALGGLLPDEIAGAPVPEVVQTAVDGRDGTASVAPPVVAEEPPVEAAGAPRVDLPSAEALARWRAARRLAGEGVSDGVNGSASVDTTRPVAPGIAVSRLAHQLGRQAQTEPGALPTPSIVPTSDAALPAQGAAPTARASEVLLRLAQAGGPVSPRSHEAGAPPPTFGPGAILPDALPIFEMPQAAEPTAALPPAVGEKVMAQLVSSLKMQWKDGIGEAKLQLRPDALGQVTVSLRVEQGAVTAVVRAESSQVQEWVLQHQQTLRQQLESAGLQLDHLTVNPDGEQGQQEQPNPESDRRLHRPRRDDESSGDEGIRFEQLL